MIKFPKIRQFSNIVRQVRERHDFKGMDDSGEPIFKHDNRYPILNFTGTVKIHGTNASIGFKGGEVKCYSRTREITPCDDNYGFAAFVFGLPDSVLSIMDCHENNVFGEWCGIGINSGCGIHGLSRRFIIFSEYSNPYFSEPDFNENEIKELNDSDIFLISQFNTASMQMDFNSPELSDFKALVDAVEANCPVAEYFGIGEGLVWTCDEDDSPDLWFKTKGQKHSATKVKTFAPCDIEKAESINDFVEKTVTKVRLEQGIEALKADGKPIVIESTGDYMRWIYNDIIDEESEMMAASGLDKKDIGRAVSQKARVFWFSVVA